jgi:hypothetical protein
MHNVKSPTKVPLINVAFFSLSGPSHQLILTSSLDHILKVLDISSSEVSQVNQIEDQSYRVPENSGSGSCCLSQHEQLAVA